MVSAPRTEGPPGEVLHDAAADAVIVLEARVVGFASPALRAVVPRGRRLVVSGAYQQVPPSGTDGFTRGALLSRDLMEPFSMIVARGRDEQTHVAFVD
eukprot:8116366-Heterocapsa_arctica.AAC.1